MAIATRVASIRSIVEAGSEPALATCASARTSASIHNINILEEEIYTLLQKIKSHDDDIWIANQCHKMVDMGIMTIFSNVLQMTPYSETTLHIFELVMILIHQGDYAIREFLASGLYDEIHSIAQPFNIYSYTGAWICFLTEDDINISIRASRIIANLSTSHGIYDSHITTMDFE
jgi:hypothetical protein